MSDHPLSINAHRTLRDESLDRIRQVADFDDNEYQRAAKKFSHGDLIQLNDLLKRIICRCFD